MLRGLLCVLLLLAPAGAAETFWFGDTWRHDDAPTDTVATHGWELSREPPAPGYVHNAPNGYLHWPLTAPVTLRSPPEADVVLQCQDGLWGFPGVSPVGGQASADLFLYDPHAEILLSGRAHAPSTVCSDGTGPTRLPIVLDERWRPETILPAGVNQLRLGAPFEAPGATDLNGTLIEVGENASLLRIDARSGMHAAPTSHSQTWHLTTGGTDVPFPTPGDLADWSVEAAVRGGWMDIRIEKGNKTLFAQNLTAADTWRSVKEQGRSSTDTADELVLSVRMDIEDARLDADVAPYWHSWTPETVRASPMQTPTPVPAVPAATQERLYVQQDGEGLRLGPGPTSGTVPAPHPRVHFAWSDVPRTLWGPMVVHLTFRCPADGTLDAVQEIPHAVHRSWSSHMRIADVYVLGAAVPMERRTCEAGEHVPWEVTMRTDGLRLPAEEDVHLEIGFFQYLATDPTAFFPPLDLVLEESWVDVAWTPGHHWRPATFGADRGGVVWTDAPAARLTVTSPVAGDVSFHDGLRHVWNLSVEPQAPVRSSFLLEIPSRWEFDAPPGTIVLVEGFAPLPETSEALPQDPALPLAPLAVLLVLLAPLVVRRRR